MKPSSSLFPPFRLTLVALLSLGVAPLWAKRPKGAVCFFPESGPDRPFFFDIRSDTPPRSVVLDTVVEPPSAHLSIANVRASNLEAQEMDANAHLTLEKRSNGQFLVATGASIHLPDYPSALNETLLYVTVRCNGRLYPLMTVRLSQENEHAPEFLGAQPYEMTIPRNAQPGALFESPLLALDRDPAERYALTFRVEPPFERDFGLATLDRSDVSVAEQARLLAQLPATYSHRVEDWHTRQLPPLVQLKVLSKSLSGGRSVYYLNVSATDNGNAESRVSYAQLKVHVKEAREATPRFTHTEYFGNFTKEMEPGLELPPSSGEPIQAVFPAQKAGDRVEYELDSRNPYAQLFAIDAETGMLRLAQKVPDAVPQTIELDILAHLIPWDASGSSAHRQSARARYTLSDQTEVKLTYFAQCHYEVHLAENPSAYTRVVKFNYRGDVEGVDLLNGSDMFKVDSDGQMSVRAGVDIDRERTERIVVKARLRSRSALHPRSLELCQIATVDILVDDVNDHSPRFTRRSYRFRVDANPFNNTEVGTLVALDGDRGEFGRVRYRLLDEFVADGRGGEEPLPFVLFQADGQATLFFVVKPLHAQMLQPYTPQSDYTFTVEAYDSEEDPRTARVTVSVRLADESSDPEERKREREEAARERAMAEQQQLEAEEVARDASPLEREEHRRRSLPDNEATGERQEAVRALAAPMLVFGGADKTAEEPKEQLVGTDPERTAERSANGAPLVRFSADKYSFQLHGPLHEGQTIGQVRLKWADQKQAQQLEFAVEEGIAGFVGVEPTSGRLFVGPWLLRDRFEEIRFSVAAQQPEDGTRVMATALVSVLIDDLHAPPEFSASLYHFEFDASAALHSADWPRRIGQVKAVNVGAENNATDRAFFYALDDDATKGEPNKGTVGVDEREGWISVGRQLGEQLQQHSAPVQIGVKACLRANSTICSRARVQIHDANSAAAEQRDPEVEQIAQREQPPERADAAEFEQFRYEVDLSGGTDPIPAGTVLARLRLRNPPADGSPVAYRIVQAAQQQGTSGGEEQELLKSGLGPQDLELDPQSGDLRAAHELHFVGGPSHRTLQLVVRAVDARANRALAQSVVLIRHGAPRLEEAELPRIEFIPLPRTMFIGAAKQPASPILRVSVRALNPQDGSWRLLPLSVFQHGDRGQSLQVEYSVEGGPPGLFRMRDNVLVASRALPAGEYDLSVRARLSQRSPLPRGEPAREQIVRLDGAEHKLRLVVMDRDGRERYPVFERISYEFEIDPKAHFPLALAPPLNASLADGHSIRFSLFPARAGDPTEGLELDPETGQLSVQRHFLDAFGAQNDSSSGGSRREVFVVVRAVNADQRQFFSDASVALLIRAMQEDSPSAGSEHPLEFDSPLYRMIVREDAPPGTVVNAASIALMDPERHPNARIRIEPEVSSRRMAPNFRLLPNGSLLLTQALDLEAMDDASKGVIELEAIAEDSALPSEWAHSRVQVQVLDVDEHSPHFVPLFPAFVVRPPLQAGQPIGRLVARDEDFSDRQPSSLVYRAISGNASRLVHVQRDGVLLVKDPGWPTGAPASLLVEVRNTQGQTTRTTVKFALEGAEEEEEEEHSTTEISPSGGGHGVGVESGDRTEQELSSGGGELPSRGSTVDVPLPATPASPTGGADPFPLFSVRTSLGPAEQALPAVHFELEPQQRAGTLFWLDPQSGVLFLQSSGSSGDAAKQAGEEEYELRVRVVDSATGRAVARRVYTVRLVQRGGTEDTTETATATTEGGEGEGLRSTTTNDDNELEESATLTTTTTRQAVETTLAAERGRTATQGTTHRIPVSTEPAEGGGGKGTSSGITAQGNAGAEERPVDDGQSGETTTPSGGGEQEEEEATATAASGTARSTQRTQQQKGGGTDNESESTKTTSNGKWTLAQRRTGSTVQQATPSSGERQEETTSSTAVPTSGRQTDSTTSPPPQHLHFALPRYHWVVTAPAPDTLIGRLEVRGQGQLESVDVEPAHFRTWFRLDDQTGDLYLRQVPEELFGRQRAEFQVRLTSADGRWARTNVTVDLHLAPRTTAEPDRDEDEANTGAGDAHQSTTTTTSTAASVGRVEVAESSDDLAGRRPSSGQQRALSAGPSLATPPIEHFSVSVSRIQFTTAPTRATPTSTRTEEESAEDDEDRREDSTASTERAPTTHTGTTSTTLRATLGREGELHFASAEYSAMLPEGRYGHSGAQLSLRPFPLAEGMPAGVEYTIDDDAAAAEPSALPFFVRRDSGELVALAEIDREERDVYTFRVRAFDPARNRSASTRVTVRILDVNDNFPQLLEPLPRVIPIGRLTPAGTRLAQLQATDPDEGAHGTVRFRMDNEDEQGEAAALFGLEPDGQLVLRKALPPAGQDAFTLRLSAIDGGRPALRTEHQMRVEVFLEGAAPAFKQPEYVAEPVPAGAAQNGTFVAQVVAGTSTQIEYSLIDPPVAHLFTIDAQSGQILMGRRPLDAERGREWALGVRASEGAASAQTTVRVRLDQFPEEAQKAAASSTPKQQQQGEGTPDDQQQQQQLECHFAERVFHAEIAENTEGRQRLVTLRTQGCDGRRVRFALAQPYDSFELEERTGDLYAVGPLDREKKSLHFLVANLSATVAGVATVSEVAVSEEDDGAKLAAARHRREQRKPTRELLFNGLVEQAKAKLTANQALVLVRVLDRNDNAPQLQQLSSEGQLVFAVDWQTPVLNPIGRVQAHDPDEHPRLQFSLQGGEGLFAINASSGVVQLVKSLQTESEQQFHLRVRVEDGEHAVEAPLTVYQLQPGVNIVLLVLNQSVDQVDILKAVRHLSALLPSLDVDVLVKQVYIDEDGHANPARSHLLVYALDKRMRVPVPAHTLKELLDAAMGLPVAAEAPVPDSPLRHLASVQVPSFSANAQFRLTSAEITLLAVSALLVFCVCGMLFLLLRCCKRRQEMITKSDVEYMLDSQTAGPRPYNVELLTRKAAQSAQLASRRAPPDALEECTMTPESRATMVASSGIYGDPQQQQQLRHIAQQQRGRTATDSSSEESSSHPPLAQMAFGNDQQVLLRTKRGAPIVAGGHGRSAIGQQTNNNGGYESSDAVDDDISSIGGGNNCGGQQSPEAARSIGTFQRERAAPARDPPPPPLSGPQSHSTLA